jgi:hypothetical protein
MKNVFRFLAFTPWLLAEVIPRIIDRGSNYQGFDGAWLVLFPIFSYYLSALLMLAGCVFLIVEAHRNVSPWKTLLFTAIAGSYFLLIFHQTGMPSGGMLFYSMLPVTLMSIGKIVLMIMLIRRWRSHLGLILIIVHAALNFLISLMYLISDMIKTSSGEGSIRNNGFLEFISRYHSTLSFASNLCAILGFLSLILFLRATKGEACNNSSRL